MRGEDQDYENAKGFRSVPEGMPSQLSQHQIVDYLFVFQYFRSAPVSASVVDKLV